MLKLNDCSHQNSHWNIYTLWNKGIIEAVTLLDRKRHHTCCLTWNIVKEKGYTKWQNSTQFKQWAKGEEDLRIILFCFSTEFQMHTCSFFFFSEAFSIILLVRTQKLFLTLTPLLNCHMNQVGLLNLAVLK